METQVSENAYRIKLTSQNAPGEPQAWTKLGDGRQREDPLQQWFPTFPTL